MLEPMYWSVNENLLRKLPSEFQQISFLPLLQSGQITCGTTGDDARCFSFRCVDCMPRLALEYYNNKYAEELQFTPQIGALGKNWLGLFKNDSGYNGEMVDFYSGYLAQIEGLRGIAVNSWGSVQAQTVFDGVQKTFEGSEFRNSKDFEIDWLLFIGNSINVVEIGRRNACTAADVAAGSITRGTRKLIKGKIDQLLKDKLIIKSLLDSTKYQDVNVNYFVVFPNLPIEEVSHELKAHKERLQKLLTLTSKLFVISSDVIPLQAVYPYLGDGGLSEDPVAFSTAVLNDEEWQSNFKHLASLVVLSKRIIRNKERGLPEMKLTRELPVGSLCSTEDKKTVKDLVKWPRNRKSGTEFPRDLVLGPEQVKAIRSDKKTVLMMGEAGSGKTTVLLSLLFRNTGRHLDEKCMSKILFYIPSHKPIFKNYVTTFVDRYCDAKWVQFINELQENEIGKTNDSTIYLLDEVYDIGVVSRHLHRGKTFAVIIATEDLTPTSKIFQRPDVDLIYFRKVYRSPESIGKCCTKLKRCLDMDNFRPIMSGEPSQEKTSPLHFKYQDLPWEMSYLNQPPLSDKSSIEWESYTSISDDILAKFESTVGKYDLAIIWDLRAADVEKLIDIFNVNRSFEEHRLKGSKAYIKKGEESYSKAYVLIYDTYQIKKCKLKAGFTLKSGNDVYGYIYESWSSLSLPFTGCEFQKVIIIFGEHVDPEIRESVTVLHSALSRAAQKAVVYCHQDKLQKMQCLLSMSTVDQVFEKLRASDNLGQKLSTFFEGRPNDVLEAFKRIIVSKNEAQFNCLWKFISECSYRQYGWVLDYVQSMLMTCFPWGREVANMLNNFLQWRPATNVAKNIFQFEGYLFVKPGANAQTIFNWIKPKFRSVSFFYDDKSAEELKKLAFHAVCWKQRRILDKALQMLEFNISAEDEFYSELLYYAITRDDIQSLKDVISLIPNTEVNLFIALKDSASFITIKMIIEIISSLKSPVEDFLLKKFTEYPHHTLAHHLASTASVESFTIVLSMLTKNSLKLSSGDIQDDLQRNILMWAVSNSAIVEMILERAKVQDDLKILVLQKDVNGWSCLRHACAVGNLQVVKLLIGSFSFPWQGDVDDDDLTLMDFVETRDLIHIMKYISRLFSHQV